MKLIFFCHRTLRSSVDRYQDGTVFTEGGMADVWLHRFLIQSTIAAHNVSRSDFEISDVTVEHVIVHICKVAPTVANATAPD